VDWQRDPMYPSSPEGKRPYWTEDHKTCVLPVQLNPGSEYRLGLNSPSFRNFRSASGVAPRASRVRL
jgi:hypothetical protein